MQSLDLLCTLKAQSQDSPQMSVSLFGLGSPQGQAPKRDRLTHGRAGGASAMLLSTEPQDPGVPSHWSLRGRSLPPNPYATPGLLL